MMTETLLCWSRISNSFSHLNTSIQPQNEVLRRIPLLPPPLFGFRPRNEFDSHPRSPWIHASRDWQQPPRRTWVAVPPCHPNDRSLLGSWTNRHHQRPILPYSLPWVGWNLPSRQHELWCRLCLEVPLRLPRMRHPCRCRSLQCHVRLRLCRIHQLASPTHHDVPSLVPHRLRIFPIPTIPNHSWILLRTPRTILPTLHWRRRRLSWTSSHALNF